MTALCPIFAKCRLRRVRCCWRLRAPAGPTGRAPCLTSAARTSCSLTMVQPRWPQFQKDKFPQMRHTLHETKSQITTTNAATLGLLCAAAVCKLKVEAAGTAQHPQQRNVHQVRRTADSQELSEVATSPPSSGRACTRTTSASRHSLGPVGESKRSGLFRWVI